MDDVHHSPSQRKEEAYLFLVDSRMRDAAAWPTPSEYEIVFNTPFHNVIGLDLLNATIARTEYIIESNERRLVYALGHPAGLTDWNRGAWMAGRRRVVDLDPGDYTLPQLLDHMNARLADVAHAHAEPALVVVPRTNPAEISNRVVFTCSTPFTLDMGASSCRHALGFGDPVTTATAPEYAAVPGWTVNFNSGASDAFLSRESTDVPAENPEALATKGPVPAGIFVQYEPVYGARTVRQHFVSDATGPAARVLTFCVATADAPQLTVRVVRQHDDVVLAAGAVDVPAVDPNDLYVPEVCELAVVAERGMLERGTQYYVEYSTAGQGTDSRFVGVYYNDDNLPVRPGSSLWADGELVQGMTACADVVVGSWAHAVTSPGVVDLTGPRYVNIRCPNIESYIFRDRVNEQCHAGLGMVTLRGYGFREQRYDFVGFPPRRFHMLGTVSRLYFRLERPDGTTYDSHGIDHTLLLVLRYYVAAPPPGFQPDARRLNPGYTPDLRDMVTHRWAEETRAKDRTDQYYGGHKTRPRP